MPDISIITINYNHSKLTKNFVDSVIEYTPSSISYEIIIVDNCSEIDDYKNLTAILNEYDVNIIRSNINTGFGGGNMLGAEHAKGKYIGFINNDVLFIEDSFTPLINFMRANPKVGVLAPQQLDRNKKPAYSFDFNHGIRRLIFGIAFINLFKKIKRERKIYKLPFKVDFIQGSFMLFDAEKFKEVGGFDANIFLYYEEMDICHRLKQKGYESYFVPLTKFIHLEGESTSKSFTIKKELLISRLYVLKKNLSPFKYQIIRFYFLIKWFFKSILNPMCFKIVSIILHQNYIESSLKKKQVIRKVD